MKNIFAIGIATLAFSTTVFADDSGFYAGVDAGSSSTGTPSSFAPTTGSTKAVAGILGGYQFNKNFGVEAKFTGAGEVSTATTSAKSDAYSLAAVGTLPLSDSFSVYGKAGYASTRTTVTGAISGATRSAPTYGIGLQYNTTSALGLRLGIDHYSEAFVDGTGLTNNYDSSVYTVGLVYKP